jgi:hypothetical protein
MVEGHVKKSVHRCDVVDGGGREVDFFDGGSLVATIAPVEYRRVLRLWGTGVTWFHGQDLDPLRVEYNGETVAIVAQLNTGWRTK